MAASGMKHNNIIILCYIIFYRGRYYYTVRYTTIRTHEITTRDLINWMSMTVVRRDIIYRRQYINIIPRLFSMGISS